MKLFVYGSLKPGGWSHHLLDDKVAGDPIPGSVRGSLYDAGSFPALRDDDGGNVHGFVYELIMPATVLMARLDILEGYPNLFDRTEMPIAIGDDIAWAVVYFGKDKSLFNEERRIDSGVWEV